VVHGDELGSRRDTAAPERLGAAAAVRARAGRATRRPTLRAHAGVAAGHTGPTGDDLKITIVMSADFVVI
jgi:hypothetical protein